MEVVERQAGDLVELGRRAKREKNPLRRDRLRAVVAALQGDDAPTIARVLGRSRRQVQSWVYAYRDGGLDALHPPPRTGRVPRLRGELVDKLKARIDAGPTSKDKVCTLRGKDIKRIINDELGVKLSVSAAYATLHRLGYSCLAPRPRHEKQDLQAQAKFKHESAPFLSSSSTTR